MIVESRLDGFFEPDVVSMIATAIITNGIHIQTVDCKMPLLAEADNGRSDNIKAADILIGVNPELSGRRSFVILADDCNRDLGNRHFTSGLQDLITVPQTTTDHLLLTLLAVAVHIDPPSDDM